MTNALEFLPTQLPYSPAVLKHQSYHGWVIEYYAYNPVTGTRERVRTNLNEVKKRFRTTMEFRSYANQMMDAFHVDYKCTSIRDRKDRSRQVH